MLIHQFEFGHPQIVQQVLTRDVVRPAILSTFRSTFPSNPGADIGKNSPVYLLKFYTLLRSKIEKLPLTLYKLLLNSLSQGCPAAAAGPMSVIDIWATSIYSQLTSVLTTEMRKTSIFAPQAPGVFQRNFTISAQFMTQLEQVFVSSMSDLRKWRSNQEVVIFLSKWPVLMYFQIRSKEIVKIAQSDTPTTVQAHAEASMTEFSLNVTKCFVAALEKLWSPSVYIPTISHKFWGFTLELIHRYVEMVKQRMNESKQAGSRSWTSTDCVGVVSDAQAFQRFMLQAFDDHVAAKLGRAAPLCQGKSYQMSSNSIVTL